MHQSDAALVQKRPVWACVFSLFTGCQCQCQFYIYIVQYHEASLLR